MSLCVEMMRKFDEYLRGTLSREEAEVIRKHVATCEVCNLVLTSAERTLESHFPKTGHRSAA